MKIELLKKGNFYKSAMHVHTNISDGKESPVTMKNAYKEKGYSVVAFTDHEIFMPHNDFTEKDFLALNGVELAVNDPYYDKGGWPYLPVYHFNFYAKNKDIDNFTGCTVSSVFHKPSLAYVSERMKKNVCEKEYSTESMNKLIKLGNEEGFLVSYDHPYGSLQTYKDYVGLEGLWGVECYNSGSTQAGMDESYKPLEDLLGVNKKVFPLAGDDAHTLSRVGGCFTMISAKELNYACIIKALEEGDFYSSTGPEIYSISIDDGILNIECSKADRIQVRTERRVSFRADSELGELTSATFDLNDYVSKSDIFEGHFERAYFRIEIKKGIKVAYSRPYFLTEIVK